MFGYHLSLSIYCCSFLKKKKKKEAYVASVIGNLVIWHVSSSQLARLLLSFPCVTPKTPKSWSSSLWEDKAKSYKIGGSISYFKRRTKFGCKHNCSHWLQFSLKKINMITYLENLIIELHVFFCIINTHVKFRVN